ncbi:beta strand repeat-containing protein [Enterovibrio norvegicus]|uniref:beta strand repeat-containing protein n=1 Tax=Enterovibrio norvegicus TaxID=188144 RepID=UPI00355448C9
MIIVSKEGETHFSDGTGVAKVGDLIVAIQDSDGAPLLGEAAAQLGGKIASVILITQSGPSVLLDSVPAEELELVLSEMRPSSSFPSLVSQLNQEKFITLEPSAGQDVHDHTHVPMFVILSALKRGVPLSEMAGFDTLGVSTPLSESQRSVFSRFLPVGELIDNDDANNHLNENAQIGDLVGVSVAKAFADGHGDVTYSLSDNAGGLFAIDPDTGVVTVAGNLDFEVASEHTIEVMGTSANNQSTTQEFTIVIANSSPEQGDMDHAITNISATDGVQGEVGESISNGVSTGLIVSAIDEDGDTITYSLVDDANGAFTIDKDTGEVTVADSSLLDFENAQSQTIEVLAVSTDGSSTTQTFSIAITDDNTEFNISGLTDIESGTNTVNESAALGSTVGLTLQATDDDGSDSISYSLSDNAGGLFAIDAVTGVVTVASALDYETATNHNITVVATSTDGTTSNQTYNIALTDDTSEFSASALADSDTDADVVSESAAIGTSVGVIFNSEDADGTDSVSYSLTDDAGGLFTIDPSTGEVTVAGALDYETASSHAITVLATSTDGSTSSKNVTIGLSDDTSEFAVTAIADTDGSSSVVSENATMGSSVGITVQAIDGDASDSVTYSLLDNAGGKFLINGTTGVVTVAGNLDYETATSHAIIVQARSTDGSTTTQTYTINVANVDALTGDTDASVGAITDTDADVDQISDVAAIGTTIGIDVSAVDADGDNIVYSLSDDASGLFTIDSSTGVVTVAADLSGLAGSSQSINVVATSSDGSSSNLGFEIDVIDGGAGAISDADSAQNMTGDASNGKYINLTAVSVDGTGDSVTYSLTDSYGGAFAINASTGRVTVSDHTLLDASTTPSVNIEVTATSSDGSTTAQTYAIAVTAETDGDDISSITNFNSAEYNVVGESAANGSTVGITVYAASESFANLIHNRSYSAVGSVNTDLRGLYVSGLPQGTVLRTYLNGSLIYTSTATNAVNTPMNPADPSNTVVSFAQGDLLTGTATYNGQTITLGYGVTTNGGTTTATRVSSSAETISYSLTDDYNGAFEINASTGVVTVKDATKLDYETDPNPTVTVQATSSGGAISSKVYGVALEDDYVAIADSYAVTEENSLVVNAASGLLANDTGDTNQSIELASDSNGTNATTVSGAVTFTTVLGGVVVVNADGSFTYTAPNLDHSSSNNIEDSFYYRVGDGSWVKVALDVSDQNVVANDDTDSVGELGTVYGNVITDNGGADSGSSDMKVTSVVYSGTTYAVSGATTIVAAVGTLIISPDGSYSFASSATGGGAHADEVFTYTVSDDDGDSDTAILTVSHDSAMTAVADVVSVYESSLVYGSEAGANLHDRVGNVLDNDLGLTGDAQITGINWDGSNYAPDGNGQITVTTDNGEFSLYTQDFGVHRAGEYQFLLTSASNGSNETEVFTYTLENASETVNASLTVSIVDDPIISFAGVETDESFTGTAANETIYGGGGADTLDGGLGDDLIVGGKGDDTLTGSTGADTFKFLHADVEGQAGVTIDLITDFDFTSDVLDLSDLLQDETEATLEDYLSVVDDGSGNAVISVSSEGDGNVDQQIVLDNTSVNDMAAAYSLDISGKSDSEVSNMVIESMLMQSQLYID